MFSPEAMETDRGKLGSTEEPVGSKQGSDDFFKNDWASSKMPTPETRPPHVTSTLIPLRRQLVLSPHFHLWLDRQQQTGKAPKPGPRPLGGGALWPKALQTKRIKPCGPASPARSLSGWPIEASAPHHPARASPRPARLPQLTEPLSGTSSDQTAQSLCHERGGRCGQRGRSASSGAARADPAPRGPTPPSAPRPTREPDEPHAGGQAPQPSLRCQVSAQMRAGL